ncbi:MAG: AAA family ATPase [Methanomassiliicoccus sp.]|nr:AAA family ATPase [Methanomassiliicoccus sp.]
MESSDLIIGREEELEFLMGQMAGALSGEGGLVLIGGEAGSGKTTLCETFEKLAAQSDCLVLVGRCIPGPQTPYLPFIEMFYGHSPDPFSADGIVNREGGGLFLSVLEGFDQLSKDKGLIIRLEDLHWADSASITLMHFLARNVRGRRILLVGTYRPEDVHATPAGEPHPLKGTLRIIRREGLCHEVDLRLLGPEETGKMVPLMLGGTAEARLQDLVASESKGNPLFAVEIINYLVDSEQVYSDGGVWRLRLKREMQIPSTIREVVLARIDALPRGTRDVLESAAVVGEVFEPDLLDDGEGRGHMELLGELEVLEKEYRLLHEDGGHYIFSHEKIRQVIYEDISAGRRKELHRSAGLMMERRLPNDEYLSQLSWHFLEAGDNDRCIRYSLAAGKLCQRRKAVREAKSFLTLVLQRTENDPWFAVDRLIALESLGDLKNDASGPREWYSYYEQYLEANQDREARARVLAKAAECWDQVGLGDAGKANELLDEAEAIADGDPRTLAEVAYRRADLSSNDGRAEEALPQIVRARHHFERLDDPVGTLKCRELEIVILRQAYRLKEARELAEEQMRIARDLEDPEPLLMVEMLAGFICAMMGDVEPAKRFTSEVIDLATKLGMMWTLRLALVYRAVALELEGDLEGARADVSRALDNAREYENVFHIAMCESDLGMYESSLGRLENAEGHYEEALRAASAFDSYLRSLLETDLSILRAELLMRRGGFRESDVLYKRMIGQAQDSGQPYDTMNCCARYAMSLARREMEVEARQHFGEAMEVAERLGCERRVRTLALRVGFAI